MNTNAQSHRPSDRVYAVDLAKNVFQVHTFGPHGECIRRQRLSRRKFAEKFSHPNTAPGVIVMEACSSSNYWARRFNELGYRTHLVPPQFVAKRRIGNKNDGNDADTVHAVSTDRRVKPVPVKTLHQQDLLALHRVRERLVKQQTQCRNQVRSLLAERGLVAKAGLAGFKELMEQLNQQEAPQVTEPLRYLVATMVEEIEQRRARLRQIEIQLKDASKQSAICPLLTTIPGIALITSTAVDAEHGNGVARFADCRQFAASIGVTPGEHSSGEKHRRGPITKRGNHYLRRLLVQGAKNVVNHCHRRDDALHLQARRMLEAGKPRNKVDIAIANRLARIVYAVIKHREPYCASGSHSQAVAA
ncbi:MAG: IS110 family transposase [Salinisphaera sp.]|nr:IS110 family transposase [Salinisphaera sp.]